ncbi:MAG: hypothetical protein V1695_00780 [Candidatus Uhrbacteria bacterium]
MNKIIIIYNQKESNKKALVFVPGFSGGLSVPIISRIISHFNELETYDVFGLNLDYQDDVIDAFENSQKMIIDNIREIKESFPEKKIFLIAKSLGGLLCFYNLDTLSVNGLVILGSSIKLGWPQRISLLSMNNPTIPDYISEWKSFFQQHKTPVHIISGSSDDLTDNSFLQSISRQNEYIGLRILDKANHDLINIQDGTLYLKECVEEIKNFVEYI